MFWVGYLIGYIIYGIIFGLITKYVAESKGYYGGFAWGFFLGVIGLLVVGFRPNINDQTYSSHTSMYPEAARQIAAEASRKTWICSCGQSNADSLSYCTRCRRSRGEDSYKPKITCPHCGAQNHNSNVTCFACGKNLSEEPKRVEKEKMEEKALPADNKNIELLQQLAKLHDQGILTDEEFQKKKDVILNNIVRL